MSDAGAWAREVIAELGIRPKGRRAGTTGPGPRMRAVVEYVAGHPGCSKSDAARCGDSGPLYRDSVERAIRRGYIRTEQDYPAAHYRLFATEAGLRDLKRRLAGEPAPGPEGISS